MNILNYLLINVLRLIEATCLFLKESFILLTKTSPISFNFFGDLCFDIRSCLQKFFKNYIPYFFIKGGMQVQKQDCECF